MKTKGVRQTGRGWEASIQVNGIRKTAMRQTKAEAVAVRKELERQLLLDQRSKPDPKGFMSHITLEKAFDTVMKDKWLNIKAKRTVLVLGKQIIDFLGRDTLLEAIDYTDLVAMQSSFKEKSNKVSTIDRKMSVIKTVFNECKRVKLIAEVPEFPQKLKGKKTKKRIFTPKEEKQFISWFRENKGDEAADIFIFLLDSCARWGEIEKLKVWDVCLTNKTVTFEDRKPDNLGSIPLSARSFLIAKKYQHREKYLFNGVGGGKLVYETYKNWFNQCKEALGIRDEGQGALTIHSTRHTCVSRLAMNNENERLMMQYGGWEDPETMNDYIHLRTDSLLSCVSVLESYHDGSRDEEGRLA